MVALALADAGDETSLTYVDRLRPSQPLEADTIVGRLRRDPQSVKARIKRQMLELLEQKGGGGRDGQSRSRRHNKHKLRPRRFRSSIYPKKASSR